MNASNNFFGDSDGEFEQGVAPDNVAPASLVLRTDFAPWHKPRKQYLRKRQWSESVGKLVDELKLSETQTPLRYLSLPGPDLLDVRSIQPVCNEKKVPLQFIGLNDEQDGVDVALRAALLNQVRSLPCIHAESDVVADRFEALANEHSIAHSRIICDQRTYDVINIDLCGSAAEAPPKQAETVINAIYALLIHQIQNRRKDWLFFLTTRSSSEKVDPAFLRDLVIHINSMIHERPEIRDNLIEKGLVLAEEFDQEGFLDQSKLCAVSHSNSFALGISFWALEAFFQNEPAWRLDMLPHFEYHVNMRDESCDMLSLGFYCKCISPAKADSLGIARIKVAGQPDKIAVKKNCEDKIARRVHERQDVDQYLSLNPGEYDRYLQESADLLKGAFYNVQAYHQWAATQRATLEAYLREYGLTQ